MFRGPICDDAESSVSFTRLSRCTSALWGVMLSTRYGTFHGTRSMSVGAICKRRSNGGSL